MKNLKTFIDVTGKRVAKGAPVSAAYDKDTIAHYKRHGLIGEPAETKPAKTRQARQPKPEETKPAAPEFPPKDPDEKGGENNPLTEADAAADLAGEPRPA